MQFNNYNLITKKLFPGMNDSNRKNINWQNLSGFNLDLGKNDTFQATIDP